MGKAKYSPEQYFHLWDLFVDGTLTFSRFARDMGVHPTDLKNYWLDLGVTTESKYIKVRDAKRRDFHGNKTREEIRVAPGSYCEICGISLELFGSGDSRICYNCLVEGRGS